MNALEIAGGAARAGDPPDRAAGPALRGAARRRRTAVMGFSTSTTATLLVLVFSSNRCPTAKAYGDRMNRPPARVRRQGRAAVAINANDPHLYPDESYPRMIERAVDDGYTVPLPGRRRSASREGIRRDLHVPCLRARPRATTPLRGTVRRLEDRGQCTSHDLRNALDDLLAGRDVRVPPPARSAAASTSSEPR